MEYASPSLSPNINFDEDQLDKLKKFLLDNHLLQNQIEQSSSPSAILATAYLNESITVLFDNLDDFFESVSLYIFASTLLKTRSLLTFPSSFEEILSLPNFGIRIKNRFTELMTIFEDIELKPKDYFSMVGRKRKRGQIVEKGVALVESLLKELQGLVKISFEEDLSTSTFIPTFISTGKRLNLKYESRNVGIIDTDTDETMAKQTQLVSISSPDPDSESPLGTFPLCVFALRPQPTASITFQIS